MAAAAEGKHLPLGGHCGRIILVPIAQVNADSQISKAERGMLNQWPYAMLISIVMYQNTEREDWENFID